MTYDLRSQLIIECPYERQRSGDAPLVATLERLVAVV